MTASRIVIATGDTRLSLLLANSLAIALGDDPVIREILVTDPENIGTLGDELQTKVLMFNTGACDLEQARGLRKDRKDLFAVGLKVSFGLSPTQQYIAALEYLKKTSVNLVLSMDTVTGHSLIASPEEYPYGKSDHPTETVEFLAQMVLSRMRNKFTRSTVVPSDPVNWNSSLVPDNLRAVVNHCIANGAYKPVLGKTAGHFAVKLSDDEILTSIRKSNFNDLNNVGLVRVKSVGEDEVIAYGARPSVGGQSQRQIFSAHPETNIAHFHCPIKEDAPFLAEIPVRPQWPNECGSHQCGANTSQGLRRVNLGDGHSLKVVFLDNHGPNIVFSNDTPAEKVIAFIDANFDLNAKTGGLVAHTVQ